MSEDPSAWDLSELEEIWARRRARLGGLSARVERRGMTRPRRNADEAKWLAARGELDMTVEIDTPLNEAGSTPRPQRPEKI
jgi:hypothetical protein